MDLNRALRDSKTHVTVKNGKQISHVRKKMKGYALQYWTLLVKSHSHHNMRHLPKSVTCQDIPI
jgi:hypothetical protein